ncbi:hypothetical protein A0U90_06390 [Kozakia baliensis]|nr:hypothetical protein A0U90_06390 [Kozakia baliensis]
MTERECRAAEPHDMRDAQRWRMHIRLMFSRPETKVTDVNSYIRGIDRLLAETVGTSPEGGAHG